MRTVIFFSLLCIASAIGKKTGWEPSSAIAVWGALIFIAATIMDITDFIYSLYKK